MVKDQKDNKPKKSMEKKLLIWFTCNYATTFKLILSSVFLLLIFTCATFFQSLPSYFPQFSCTTSTTATTTTTTTTLKDEYIQQPLPQDQILDNGVVRRRFHPFGSAAYSFILMSAYRGGPNTFSIIGLSSKPLQVFSRPSYQCQYNHNIPNSLSNNNNTSPLVTAHKILPDWGFGRVYTVVVLNCTFSTTTTSFGFSSAAAAEGAGGKLLLQSSTIGTTPITALVEPPNSWHPSLFSSHPKYDFLYCGSPLYGDLSPQRIREWIAYHVHLFGKRSHFVIHDAGGIHPEVVQVLKPWIDLGYVTLQDVREQERFDGYYHNQFLVVNDCLHRYRFDAKWIFFFDVDEYIYVPPTYSFRSVMDSFRKFTQFTIGQVPMANKLCLAQDSGKTSKKWVMEKLVYKNVKKVARRDRKYAVQPRNVYATGVHLSKNFEGESIHKTEKFIKYFHYHGTIATRQDTCQYFLNDKNTTLDETPYVMETNMRSIAYLIKKFELDTIGSILESTKQ